MSDKKSKFYVVWKGHKPGIYKSWEDCKEQIKGFKGPQYMAFHTEDEAKHAFSGKYKNFVNKKGRKKGLTKSQRDKIGQPNLDSISVDAAVGGNPGKMEYRGVDTRTKKVIFKQGPFDLGTNNIGEFLALVHALAHLKKRNDARIIYSDSRIAMGWVKKKTL